MSQSFSGPSTHPKSHDQGDALSVPYLISQTARTGGISVPWIRKINGERTSKSSSSKLLIFQGVRWEGRGVGTFGAIFCRGDSASLGWKRIRKDWWCIAYCTNEVGEKYSGVIWYDAIPYEMIWGKCDVMWFWDEMRNKWNVVMETCQQSYKSQRYICITKKRRFTSTTNA